MKQAEKQVVLVTGASQGVGRATGERLARDGWHVALAARRIVQLEEVVAGIRSEGGSAEAVILDVTDAKSIPQVVAGIVARCGRLDGLVNNAGRYTGRGILETDLKEFRQNFAMNVDAAFLTMKAALPQMIAQQAGSIVNIGSVSGLRATQGAGGYGSSKAALAHLSAVIAMEMGQHGVRVNMVTPGTTRSPAYLASIADKTAEEIEAMERSGTMLGRFGEPSEIADAVAFLLSDDARFITGVNLPVDGGAYWFRGGNRLIGKRH